MEATHSMCLSQIDVSLSLPPSPFLPLQKPMGNKYPQESIKKKSVTDIKVLEYTALSTNEKMYH